MVLHEGLDESLVGPSIVVGSIEDVGEVLDEILAPQPSLAGDEDVPLPAVDDYDALATESFGGLEHKARSSHGDIYGLGQVLPLRYE